MRRVMSVFGTVQPGYETVREAFAAGQEGDEGDAQLAVYRDGRLVVDLWSGRWSGESAVILMSCTKGLMATCVHMLAEQGRLDIDAAVQAYWPEFSSPDVTVRHLLTHSAGLPGFAKSMGVDAQKILDWEACTEALAAAEPLWKPGTAYRYHSLTFGHLVGEVIRRITGQTPGEFFRASVAEPLGLALWVGLPAGEEGRVTPIFSTNPLPGVDETLAQLASLGIDINEPVLRTVMEDRQAGEGAESLFNRREGRAAEIPAANGIGNARSLARMYAALIGEVDGVRLLHPDQVAIASTPQTDDLPAAGAFAAIPTPNPLRFALGYEAPRPGNPMLGSSGFGHSGLGGRLSFADPESGLAVGYTCTNGSWNVYEGADPRWLPWLAALGDL
ncbi:serine hydrolase domain-containing protein [Streptomyces sp. NPDC088387]|uniref:serine hydrolase domain-containing protein n=1 Tax=Streptomyces sp. NPDC088387 TaxID=3365859 RepID=UPI0037F5FE71